LTKKKSKVEVIVPKWTVFRRRRSKKGTKIRIRHEWLWASIWQRYLQKPRDHLLFQRVSYHL